MSSQKNKKKLTFAEIKRQLSMANGKDKIFGGICFVAAVGLTIWFIFFHLM